MPLYHTIRNQRSAVGHNASDARQTYEGNLSARTAPDSAGCYIRFKRTKSSNREESTKRNSKKRCSVWSPARSEGEQREPQRSQSHLRLSDRIRLWEPGQCSQESRCMTYQTAAQLSPPGRANPDPWSFFLKKTA